MKGLRGRRTFRVVSPNQVRKDVQKESVYSTVSILAERFNKVRQIIPVTGKMEAIGTLARMISLW